MILTITGVIEKERPACVANRRHAKQEYPHHMSIEELESVVSRLPAGELAQFSQWFEEFMADQWDRQIEQDVQAGRLDGLLKQADQDYADGLCKPLRTISQRQASGSISGNSLKPSRLSQIKTSR